MWRKHISRTKKDCQLWTKKNQRRSSQKHTLTDTQLRPLLSSVYCVFPSEAIGNATPIPNSIRIPVENDLGTSRRVEGSRRRSSVCLWLDSGAKCPANRISTPSRQQRRSTTCLKRDLFWTLEFNGNVGRIEGIVTNSTRKSSFVRLDFGLWCPSQFKIVRNAKQATLECVCEAE